MTRNRLMIVGITSVTLGAFIATLSASDTPCPRWDLSGHWELLQSGVTVKLDLEQSGSRVSGTGQWCEGCLGTRPLMGPFGAVREGKVEGNVDGNNLEFTIQWTHGPVGEYKGSVDESGRISGSTRDLNHPENVANWNGNRAATCNPFKKLGKSTWMATAKNDVDIYDGPGGQYNVIGMLEAGVTAPIIKQQEDWFQLKLANVPGGSGWVAGDHLNTVINR